MYLGSRPWGGGGEVERRKQDKLNKERAGREREGERDREEIMRRFLKK